MNNDASALIENYLLGLLDKAGASQVETRAETDAAFARELQFQQEVLRGIESYGDAQMRAKIAGIDRALEEQGFFNTEIPAVNPEAGAGSSIRLFYWIVAAGILLAAGAALWRLLDRPRQAPPAQPVAEAPVAAPERTSDPSLSPVNETGHTSKTATKADPGLPFQERSIDYLPLARGYWTAPEFSNVRSDGQNTGSLFARAQAAFQKADYTAVNQMLKPLAPSDPDYWPLMEMQAHGSFLSGKIQGATTAFQRIADSGQLPFSERAEWYLLLCRLAQLPKDRPAFDILLNKILSDTGHPYYEPAREISGKIH